MCVQSGGVGFVLGLEIGDRSLEKRKKKKNKILNAPPTPR